MAKHYVPLVHNSAFCCTICGRKISIGMVERFAILKLLSRRLFTAIFRIARVWNAHAINMLLIQTDVNELARQSTELMQRDINSADKMP